MRRFDLLIRGGTLLDLDRKTEYTADVMINGNEIAELGDAAGAQGRTEIDAKGKYVLPGLIDSHMHTGPSFSSIGTHADLACIPNGVTTAVDAGTSGWANFPALYREEVICDTVSVYALLNISPFGVQSPYSVEEPVDEEHIEDDRIIALFHSYPEVIKGLKIRMCKNVLGENGLQPLVHARSLSDRLAQKGYYAPLVVHYEDLPNNVALCDVLTLLRKGDILAHTFQVKGETIFDSSGEIKSCLKEARDRGVLFDSCNGKVHWSCAHVKKAAEQGFLPDIISSDLVRATAYTHPAAFSLPRAMQVWSAAGMSVYDIVRAVTATPAMALRLCGRGMLAPGCPADLTVMDIVCQHSDILDIYGGKMPSNKTFVPLMTIKGGSMAYRQITTL